MKKRNIIIAFIAIYLIIGSSLFFYGGVPKEAPLGKVIMSGAIVTVGWPVFVVGKIFYN